MSGKRVRYVPISHTELTWNSLRGSLTIVKDLVNDGADPCVPVTGGNCAVNFAAMKDFNLPVLQYFLAHLKYENQEEIGVGHLKIPPLVTASACGAYETAKYLLTCYNAPVNEEDPEGFTSLHRATLGGHFEVVKLLVEHGACVYLGDKEFRNVLHLIVRNHKGYKSGEVMLDLVKYFVGEVGLDLNLKCLKGSTPLHDACEFGLVKVAKYLVEQGANLEAKRNGWQTPLWSFLMSEQQVSDEEVGGMMRLLLDVGADFSVRCCLGLGVMEYVASVRRDNEVWGKCLDEVKRALRARMEEPQGSDSGAEMETEDLEGAWPEEKETPEMLFEAVTVAFGDVEEKDHRKMECQAPPPSPIPPTEDDDDDLEVIEVIPCPKLEVQVKVKIERHVTSSSSTCVSPKKEETLPGSPEVKVERNGDDESDTKSISEMVTSWTDVLSGCLKSEKKDEGEVDGTKSVVKSGKFDSWNWSVQNYQPSPTRKPAPTYSNSTWAWVSGTGRIFRNNNLPSPAHTQNQEVSWFQHQGRGRGQDRNQGSRDRGGQLPKTKSMKAGPRPYIPIAGQGQGQGQGGRGGGNGNGGGGRGRRNGGGRGRGRGGGGLQQKYQRMKKRFKSANQRPVSAPSSSSNSNSN